MVVAGVQKHAHQRLRLLASAAPPGMVCTAPAMAAESWLAA